MKTMLGRLELNKAGELSLWKLCCFLIARHDEMVAQRDERTLLNLAFTELFRVDAQGMVSEEELKRVFLCQNAVQLFGIDEPAYMLLKHELSAHVPDAEGLWRVPLAALVAHPAFRPMLAAGSET